MVRAFSTFVALAVAFSHVMAAPVSHHASDDSAIGNEVAVSASGGVVRSDLSELARQTGQNDQQNYAAATTTAWAHKAKETAAEKAEHATTTTTEHRATTTAAEEHATDTAKAEATPTNTHELAEPTYGSGYAAWGGKGYNDCVQQCVAKFGKPAATYTAAPVEETATPTADAGTGTTHTVIVAPTQGVLRYIPFAVNASVGDTVRFIWGAGPHTVTKSSALNPCNNSLDASFFASGRQNKSFVFDKVVNDTEPTFFYCAVPSHCQKGMYGIINPPNGSTGSVNSTVTIGSYMQSMAQKDASVAALWSYVTNKTAGTAAENWGMKMDISSMPETEYGNLAQNTMYTQLFYAANPGLVEADKGAFDINGSGIIIPDDITATLQNLAVSDSPASSSYEDVPSAANPTAANANAAANAGSSSVPSSGYTNGSGRLASSTGLVGAFAIVAAFFMM